MQRHFQVSPPSAHQMVLTLERAAQSGGPRPYAQHEMLVKHEDLRVLR